MFHTKISKKEFLILCGILILLFFVLRSMFIILFLTFIFSYLANSILKMLEQTKLRVIPHKLLTTILFLLFITILTILSIIIIPSAYRDTLKIFQSVPPSFNVNEFIRNDVIKNIPLLNKVDEQSITQFLNDQAISKIAIPDITTKITTLFGIILGILIEIFVAFILAFFIVLERKELAIFFTAVEKGPIGRYYQWIRPYFIVLADSFGKTFESQAVIALINSVLTILGLYFFGFNYLLALWFIVFIFSFIPVLGVIISSVPIIIIGFIMGGFYMVLNIIILIAIIHFIEAYFLNPKIYASRAHLPITIAFIALVAGEFIGGAWGLLLAIPTLYFLYNVFVLEKVKWHVDK